MHKVFKSLPVFSLCLAGVAILAHLIIPHDHHLAESDITQEDRCPASDNNSNHNKGLPVHCHAFNDLTTEKVVNTFNIRHIRLTDVIHGILFNNPISFTQFSCLTILNIFKLPVNSGILELSSLRAPPSFF